VVAGGFCRSQQSARINQTYARGAVNWRRQQALFGGFVGAQLSQSTPRRCPGSITQSYALGAGPSAATKPVAPPRSRHSNRGHDRPGPYAVGLVNRGSRPAPPAALVAAQRPQLPQALLAPRESVDRQLSPTPNWGPPERPGQEKSAGGQGALGHRSCWRVGLPSGF